MISESVLKDICQGCKKLVEHVEKVDGKRLCDECINEKPNNANSTNIPFVDELHPKETGYIKTDPRDLF